MSWLRCQKTAMDNNSQKKVITVVVTYNRKELLSECLDAVLSQTYSIYKLIIIDNASTDGTAEMLHKKGTLDKNNVVYHNMERNTGGAGGFCAGLEMTRDMDGNWIWLMDDDTIPNLDTLEKLIEKTEVVPDASFLASCVCGENHEPMNVPVLNIDPTKNGYPDWYMNLDQKMVKVSSATFVSIIVNAEAIKKCGLPCRDYFIWGDDFEYTKRLTKFFGDGFLVGDSWICHKRKNVSSMDLKNENDKNRIKNFFYFYRNELVNTCVYEGKSKYLRRGVRFFFYACSLLPKSCGLLKFRIVCKGIISSALDVKKLRTYIEDQLA